MVGIREIRPADRDAWLTLYQGYADHYQVALTKDGVATTWSWLMDDAHVLQGLVAVQNNKLIGLAHVRAMPSPLRGVDVGFLDDLFVSPDARGGQVGEALIDEVKHIAALKGWPVVRWITRDDNYRARSLYDRVARKADWNTYELWPNAE